jgi:hypothetical protein
VFARGPASRQHRRQFPPLLKVACFVVCSDAVSAVVTAAKGATMANPILAKVPNQVSLSGLWLQTIAANRPAAGLAASLQLSIVLSHPQLL